MFREPNRALWWVVGGAAAGMGLILCVPFLRTLSHFNALDATDFEGAKSSPSGNSFSLTYGRIPVWPTGEEVEILKLSTT